MAREFTATDVVRLAEVITLPVKPDSALAVMTAGARRCWPARAFIALDLDTLGARVCPSWKRAPAGLASPP